MQQKKENPQTHSKEKSARHFPQWRYIKFGEGGGNQEMNGGGGELGVVQRDQDANPSGCGQDGGVSTGGGQLPIRQDLGAEPAGYFDHPLTPEVQSSRETHAPMEAVEIIGTKRSCGGADLNLRRVVYFFRQCDRESQFT